MLATVAIAAGSLVIARYCQKSAKYRHVVMFSLKGDTSEAQIAALKASLLNLPQKIPQIVSYELGTDLLLPAGQKHPAGKNRFVCWTATFASVEAYQVYETHPAHLEVISTCIKPVMEPGSRGEPHTSSGRDTCRLTVPFET